MLLGFFALGSAVIIISGGIDLSSGSVIAMSATVFGTLLMFCSPEGFRSGDIPVWAVIVSIAGTLLAGAAVGTLHAWLITSVGLPPFIATLATLVGLRSFSPRTDVGRDQQQDTNRLYQRSAAQYAEGCHQYFGGIRDVCLRGLVSHEPHGTGAATCTRWAATSKRPGSAVSTPID